MVTHCKAVALAALLIGASSLGASAGVYNLGAATGALATDTSLTRSFTAGGAGSGVFDFAIQGYISLDGVNFYEDDITIKLNGTTIFSGSFDLGGGGSNAVFSSDPSATYMVNPVSTGSPTFAGGTLTVSTPVSFLAGTNTVEFSYKSLTEGHAGFQGLGDEGWGLNRATVTSAVPEPSTWAMMLIGLAGLGLFARRSPAKMA